MYTSLTDPQVRVKASVILVSYNSHMDLERCLPGLVESLPSDAEIIVVDNASSDGSAEYVRSNDMDIILACSSSNLGYGGANNLAARLARGQYLVFLNPDTVVRPHWLEALLAAFESNPNAGLVTPSILLLDEPTKVNTCGNDIHISGLTMCRGMGQPQGAFSTVGETAAVSGAAFAIGRELFLRLGGFDEQFFLYMEDTDLSLRARLAGYDVLSVSDAVIDHDYQFVCNPMKTYYQERNRYRMLLKCLHWRTLLTLLPVLLLAEAVTWGFVLVFDRGNWQNKLRAYGTVIRDLGEILDARVEAQRMRCVPDSALLRMTSACLDFRQVGDGWPVAVADRLFNPMFKVLHGWVLRIVGET